MPSKTLQPRSLTLVLVVLGCGGGATIHYFETEGNLERTHDLDCMSGSRVEATFTPADLYPAVAECIEDDRFQEAVELYAVAYSYVLFDTRRVRDESAHQAVNALQAQTLGQVPRSDAEAFFAYFQQVSVPGSAPAEEICRALRRLGPPTYEPRYMIQHGLDAVLGKAVTDPSSNFDTQEAWNAVLEGPMRCVSAPAA